MGKHVVPAETSRRPGWKDLLLRNFRQPAVGTAISIVAGFATVESWLSGWHGIHSHTAFELGALSFVLAFAIFFAYRFPVHIRFSTKLYMGSVPLYLTAVLLPPPLAAVVTAVGLTAGELSVRKERDLYLSDIATQVGRWMVLNGIASHIAHLSSHSFAGHAAVLAATAGVLFAGDALTLPIQIIPITGERPGHILHKTIFEGGPTEAGQYTLGFIGGLLAAQDVWATTLLLLPIGLLYHASKRAKEMAESTKLLLENMADTVDSRDAFTHNHSVRVTEWTRRMIRELRLTGPEAELIVTAARVHDIGKMSIPDEILHKHEKLSEEEWKILQMHPAIGADMLKRYPAFARGAEIVRGHHERYDGKGYPDGLAGTDIPYGARLLAVVDSYDAMVSDRPYRKGMPVERAAGILASGRGTQWDPELVDAFLRVIADQLEQPVQVSHLAGAFQTV